MPRSIEANRRASTKYNHAHPSYGRNSHLTRKFGITLEQYERLSIQQGGVCAICGGTNSSGKLLAVDHDHETGLIRGLLCQQCNVGLGCFKDDTTALAKAIVYLREGGR